MSDNVTVKFDDESFSLRFQPNWSVRRFKQEIGRMRNEEPTRIRIIFAGQELPDNYTLQNCQMNESVVHVVRRLEASSQVTAENILINVNLSSDRTSCFFVYCKRCGRVTRGKLRCRCSLCRDGSFVISQGPSCWEDVLIKGNISGRCESNRNCENAIAEFYFKCGEHKGQDEQSPLPMLKSNTRRIPCITCGEICDLVLVFPCENKHTICRDCFIQYCSVNLNERRYTQTQNHGYSIACPGNCDDCEQSFVQDSHHFRLLGNDQYNRYQRFAAEEYLRNAGGVLCPGRECGQGIFPRFASRRVTCEYGCGLVFCRQCSRDYHNGPCQPNETVGASGATSSNTFEVTEVNNQRARWNRESEEAIQNTTKRCPNKNCNIPVEKNGGCNHMTCARCRHEWCWLCRVPWGRECRANHWFRA